MLRSSKMVSSMSILFSSLINSVSRTKIANLQLTYDDFQSAPHSSDGAIVVSY